MGHQTFQEFQEKTTQSMLRFQSLPSLVMVRLMEDTMLIQKLSVKHSTSALLMVLEVLPSTASSAPMELSSIRTTSSVTGGSTLTVPLLRTSTVSMMRLLPREMLLLVPLIRLSMELLPSMELPLHQLETTLLPGELLASLEDSGEQEEGGTKEVREEEED